MVMFCWRLRELMGLKVIGEFVAYATPWLSMQGLSFNGVSVPRLKGELEKANKLWSTLREHEESRTNNPILRSDFKI